MPSHQPPAQSSPARAREPEPRAPGGAKAPPAALVTRAHVALRLQRAAGNAATAALIAGLANGGRRAVQRQPEAPAAAPAAAAPAPGPQPAGAPPGPAAAQPAKPGEGGGVMDRILGKLAEWARKIPGYGLLGVVIGRDPLSGAPVERTAVNIVGGFMSLIPGGQGMFENLQRSGAVERAGAWLDAEVPRLGLTWEYLKGLLRRAWDALSVFDLLSPSSVWEKVSGIFTEPVQRLLAFGRDAAGKLLEFIFEGVLSLAGAAGGQVMGIVRKAGDVLGTIVRNPIGFASNLIGAVRGGLGRFMENIGSHLKTGLFAWLTGAMRGAISLPSKFDLRGILSLVLQVLGLTWSWVRKRLVDLLGERVVGMVEKAVDWIQRIATGGLAAVWERIMEFASGLVDSVIGGIRDWVAKSVVGAAITKLITMFNPAGAIIQAIIAVYNTVQFFIERAQQLAALATSVFESIASIAAGNLGNAIGAVENAMARTLPVVLGFLARLIGLGDVAGAVKGVIDRVRAVVDKALDKVIEWLVGLAKRLVGRGAAAGPQGAPSSPEPHTVMAAVTTDVAALQLGDRTQPDGVRAALAGIYAKHRPKGLKLLRLQEVQGKPGRFEVVAEASPAAVVGMIDVNARVELEDLDLAWETVLTATLNGQSLGVHRSERGKHAEIHLLGVLEHNWEQLAEEGRDNNLTVKLTRSPCPECAAALDRFVSAKRRSRTPLKMELNMMSLHRAGQRDAPASLITLELLRQRGHTLKVWDVVEELKAGDSEALADAKLDPATERVLARRIDELRTWLGYMHQVKVP
jgi:hypothetical protein